MPSQTRKRNPWVAMLLSLLSPGLGQIYNTQLKKGLIFLFGSQAISWYLLSGDLLFDFSGLFITVISLLALEFLAMSDAWISARLAGEIRLRSCNHGWVYILIAAAELLITIQLDSDMPFETYRIPSSSMEETLLIGDRLMARHSPATAQWPHRGAIAVFAFPQDPTKDFVKRVIALPGDTVSIQDKQVYVNHQAVSSGHEHHGDAVVRHDGDQAVRDQLAEFTVAPGQYFVLGDNRDHSYDSRFWGTVPAENIKARPLYIYWSRDISRIGSVIE